MNLVPSHPSFQTSASTNIWSPTPSFSALLKLVAISIPNFGPRRIGSGKNANPSPTLHSGIKWGPLGPPAGCLKNFHFLLTGLSTSATPKPALTHVGQKNPCPPRPNGIAPPTALFKARSSLIPGAQACPNPNPVISISAAGILLPS